MKNEEEASTDVLVNDLDGEENRDLFDDLVGSPFRNSSQLFGDYKRLTKSCSVASEPIPSLVAGLLLLALRGLERISTVPIMKVRVGALEWTLSSNDTRIGVLESQLLSKNSELDVIGAKL